MNERLLLPGRLSHLEFTAQVLGQTAPSRTEGRVKYLSDFTSHLLLCFFSSYSRTLEVEADFSSEQNDFSSNGAGSKWKNNNKIFPRSTKPNESSLNNPVQGLPGKGEKAKPRALTQPCFKEKFYIFRFLFALRGIYNFKDVMLREIGVGLRSTVEVRLPHAMLLLFDYVKCSFHFSGFVVAPGSTCVIAWVPGSDRSFYC